MALKIENLEIVRIAQIPIELVYKEVLLIIKGQESFIDADETIGENIYSVSALEELLNDKKVSAENVIRLKELYSVVKTFEYVMFTKI